MYHGELIINFETCWNYYLHEYMLIHQWDENCKASTLVKGKGGGGGGKKISLSFQALPVLYSYMQQSNVPQLEGNSICAAVRNAKYIPEYMVTGRKYTQCRGTCPKELESSFPFPFAKCVISFQLFTTCSRNLDRRIEESFEEKKRPCQISTSINQGTKQLFPRNPPPLL